MQKIDNRLFFYTSDLMRLSGKCERSCRRTMKKMRDFFKLESYQELTMYQVSEFLRIPVEHIAPYLKC
ncbi:hypothetical protein [Desertivirga brevis]|uniref:hypothetical protein n=1 Tax=Desertivirga brevis TaxID=2810310 RepID=UPI001A972234|nr:hypothetical protein [Pedobacter sp. SYSU D00873]